MYSLFYPNVQTQKDDAIAFVLVRNDAQNREMLTWKQANQIVDDWALYLHQQGVKQGDCISVLTKNEYLYPFIHLALDKLNTTIAPLDTETPSEQFKHLSFIKNMLIDASLSGHLTDTGIGTVPLEQVGIAPPAQVRATSSPGLPPIERDPAIANYIVASSGVTQSKKWIPVKEKGLLYWADIEKRLLDLGPDDKVLCTRSPAYDARISEYVRAFAGGGTLVLLPQEFRRDLHEIVRQCGRERITCLILIASQLNTPDLDALIQRLADSGLKHLMVTGDACSVALKNACEKAIPAINLWNCYGPTEATFGMSILRVNNLDTPDGIVPIGRPNSDIIRYHLNAKGRLFIESPFLSDGYISDEGNTKKNFPVIHVDGRDIRVFDTENKFTEHGDYLVFHGRINNSSHCKVSGVKVEAHAIQECLEQYRDDNGLLPFQVYVVIKTWNDSLKPVAYLVINHDVCMASFTKFLKERLRMEEMPVFICLDRFPRLIPSEKIDRIALINRVDQPEKLFFESVSPSAVDPDALLNHLQQIWASVLGREAPDIDQEFIFSGGDSRKLHELSLRIQHEINSEFCYQQLIHLSSITLREIHQAIMFRTAKNVAEALVKPLSLRESGRGNCFFLPPLLGEGYFTYLSMAGVFYKYFKLNLYGLTDPALYGMALPPANMEESVERFVHAIRRVQPKGPYHLLGFSFGATFAYYVAQNLLAAGESIEMLHLVDGFPPIVYQRLPSASHAKLLEELAGFIVQTLVDKHDREEALKRIPPSASFDKNSIEEQINLVFNHIAQDVIKPESRHVLALTRQHLLNAHSAPPPTRIPTKAQLYLSDRYQTYLSVVKCIPELKGLPVSRQFYYWNGYFDEVVSDYGHDAMIGHLELLKKSDQSIAALDDFWETSNESTYGRKFTPFYTEWLEYNVREKEFVLRFKIFALPRDQVCVAPEFEASEIETQTLFEHIGTDLDTPSRTCSSHYTQTFTAPLKSFHNIHSFFEQKGLRRVISNKPAMGLQNLQREVGTRVLEQAFCIVLMIQWNFQPLVELSFTCRADPLMGLTALFMQFTDLIQRPGSPKREHPMLRCIHLIHSRESSPSSSASSREKLNTAQMLIDQFIITLEPYTHESAVIDGENFFRL